MLATTDTEQIKKDHYKQDDNIVASISTQSQHHIKQNKQINHARIPHPLKSIKTAE